MPSLSFWITTALATFFTIFTGIPSFSWYKGLFGKLEITTGRDFNFGVTSFKDAKDGGDLQKTELIIDIPVTFNNKKGKNIQIKDIRLKVWVDKEDPIIFTAEFLLEKFAFQGDDLWSSPYDRFRPIWIEKKAGKTEVIRFSTRRSEGIEEKKIKVRPNEIFIKMIFTTGGQKETTQVHYFKNEHIDFQKIKEGKAAWNHGAYKFISKTKRK